MQRLEYNGETVMSDWLVGESFPEEVIGELSLERRVGSGGGRGWGTERTVQAESTAFDESFVTSHQHLTATFKRGGWAV